MQMCERPLLTEPTYCVHLLLQQFEDPASVLHSDLLVGLAVRCACQIALDYRRLDSLTTGGLDAQLARTTSRGSPGDPQLRRQSATSLEERQRHAQHAAFDAMRSTANASIFQELEKRMIYIQDSHVEDSGTRDCASPSLVRPFGIAKADCVVLESQHVLTVQHTYNSTL